MILYPGLVQGNGTDAVMLTPDTATTWPKLLDIDEITAAPVPAASADENDCCWPPLEPPFRERWAEMPATWFFTAASMELQP
jgi:hypothetical protein